MRRLIAIGCLAAVSLTACGGSGGSTPTQVVTGAAAATRAGGSAHFSLTLTGASPAPLTIDGGLNFATNAADFSFTVPAALARGTAGIAGAKIEVVIQGADYFLNVPPALASQIPGGKRWLKLNTAALNSIGSSFGGGLTQSFQGPADSVTQLLGAASTVVVGSEVVRGASTTHYRGTLDLNAAAAKLPKAQSDALLQGVKTLGTAVANVDVWLDSNGRARRIVTVTDTSKATTDSLKNAPGHKLTVQAEYFDYGTTVSATPPPADQTVDLSGLLGKGG